MTEKPSSLPKWITGLAGGIALMLLGGWVNDQRRDAAETVVIAQVRSDLSDLKQAVAAGDAQVDRNSQGRSLAFREEFLRIVSQLERRLDRLEDAKR